MTFHPHASLRAAAAWSLALLVLSVPVASVSAAQLVLPHKPPEKAPDKPHGNVAPYVVCLVCGTRSYTGVPDGRKDEQGNDLVWCDACKRDTPHHSSNPGPGIAPTAPKNPGGKEGVGLALPPKPKSGEPAQAGSTPPAKGDSKGAAGNAPKEAGTAGTGAATPANGGAAANFVFAEVAKARAIDDVLVNKGIETLISAGEPGLAAARRELNSDVAPVLVTAARVLLRAGTGEDIALVQDRLRTKMPSAACGPVLDELVKRDPVRAGPSYLCDLLEHPQTFARQAAERHLRKDLGPELLPLLEPHLASKHAETRLAVVALAADIPEAVGTPGGTGASGPIVPGAPGVPGVPGSNTSHVTPILLRVIDDPAPRVAAVAVNALANRDDPGLDAQLLAIAFHERWVLRRGAYALIAILQREDQRFQPVLGEAHVEALLGGIDSSDPFVSGTCAAALAGIGFRGADAKRTDWLDQIVMDHLVATASGREFNSDLGALVPITLRRLRLVSGQSIATDGPAWVEWWIGARNGFHARRANLAVEPSEIPSVLVRYEATGEKAELFTIVGPELAPKAASLVTNGEIVYVTGAEAAEIVAGLGREGLLGSERLPGLRGVRGRGERTLEIAFNNRAKGFTLGPGFDEPWFARAAELLRAVHDKNRWQRFPEIGKHADTLALWKEQSAWWAADHTPAERAARLKGLVLGAMQRGSPAQRELCVNELERLYATPENIEPQDFTPLLTMLRLESTQGERARKLTRLALAAGRAAGTGNRLPDPLALDLTAAFCDLFGTNANEALSELFAASSREFVRRAAADARPLVRAAACKTLVQAPTDADVAVLIKLLDDKDPSVEAAAALALGERKVEAARTELLVRARLGLTPVRVAALQAIGRMGGEYVLDALVLGVSDKDPEVRLAATKGLADLADPSATQILVSLLAEKGDAQVYEAARNGLEKLGPRAHPDLIRAMNAPGGKVRREAALLLAELGVPDAASPLISMLTAAPNDARVAYELVVLTCVDLRSQLDPPQSWWSWWDGVRHDDALAWFRAALERVGLQSPPPGTLEGDGTQQGRLFLASVMARPEPWLVERARRELKRLLGNDPGMPPPVGPERDLWLRKLRDLLEQRGQLGGLAPGDR